MSASSAAFLLGVVGLVAFGIVAASVLVPKDLLVEQADVIKIVTLDLPKYIVQNESAARPANSPMSCGFVTDKAGYCVGDILHGQLDGPPQTRFDIEFRAFGFWMSQAQVTTDETGIYSADLPLSDEGDYVVRARSNDCTTEPASIQVAACGG